MKLPTCPYCGKSLSYFEALMEKDGFAHKCRRCSKLSNIFVSKNLFRIFQAILALTIIYVVLYIIFGYKDSIIGFIIVFIPYLIFYALSPYYVRLTPQKNMPGKVKQITGDDISIDSIPQGSTRVMPKLSNNKPRSNVSFDNTTIVNNRDLHSNRRRSQPPMKENSEKYLNIDSIEDFD
ncbi:MAG: hypothetical protein Q8876_05030 [Bacillota bacterium]|nr:hypothetical protein [Bacillota bacterium]